MMDEHLIALGPDGPPQKDAWPFSTSSRASWLTSSNGTKMGVTEPRRLVEQVVGSIPEPYEGAAAKASVRPMAGEERRDLRHTASILGKLEAMRLKAV
jgi:hypothetical protein